MSDHDSNAPEWASDPAVAGWLGTPDPAPPGEGSDVVAAEQNSPPEQRPTDDSVWAHDPAVAQWLDTPPPPDRGEDTVAAPDAAPPPVAGTGYDADATIQMAPITDSTIPPRSAVPPSPLAPAPTATATATGMATTTQVPGFYPLPTPTGRRLRRPQRRTAVMASAVAAAAVLVLGLVITAFSVVGNTSNDSDGPVAQPPPPPVLSQSATTAEDADCPNRTDGPVTTGRDAGDTTSGPGVIKAFEHAYYVARDGAKARALGIELARMGSAQAMQTFIDTQLAPGTVHCVRITERGPQLWALELTEIAPGGGETQTIHQLVQTATINGRVLIAAITKDTAP